MSGNMQSAFVVRSYSAALERRERKAIMKLRYFVLVLLLLVALGMGQLGSAQHRATFAGAAHLQLGQTAPDFNLKDLKGKPVQLAKLRGKPVVLFVFCACAECAEVSKLWVQLNQDGRISTSTEVPTLVTYMGSKEESAEFSARHGYSTKTTTFLDDPKSIVAQKFRAMPCPAAFVIDQHGRIQYSNKLLDEREVVPPGMVVSQVLHTVRTLLQKPPQAPKSDPGQVQKQSLFLSPVKEKETILETEGTLIWRPQKPKTNAAGHIIKDFKFINKTRETIEILQVLSSCGCQRSELIGPGATRHKATLKPGASVTLEVELDLSGFKEGSKSVRVWLYAKNQTLPVGSVWLEFARF